MGFFSKILDKLGIGSARAATPSAAPAAPASPTTSTAAPAPATPSPGTTAAAPVNPIAMVDVVAQMEQRAAANPQKLNWKTSIVDLLKLLDLDSSLAARKELATELGCPADLMGDSAQMNMWLHKNVLAHIAANGGNIPQAMLD
ncbi:MAG: oxidoreductase [Comamonadaceae bacterium CG_4_9_14_3_um_filter_60_33]|nr:MAG: oxidoreductase [Comamonadaceae bacterium CG2_30_59_20]PIY27866.1 MAG: oxidoreductase [Comamonadaceae bacterium CG_4_10_14_3_um_filter_60_42]PJB40879.1 MAG: oxidoreductase [Comamonadaceae bacterium CG_4_9_14_3_um_filter_60_33]